MKASILNVLFITVLSKMREVIQTNDSVNNWNAQHNKGYDIVFVACQHKVLFMLVRDTVVRIL